MCDYRFGLYSEKSRLGKSESHWSKLTIFVAKYSARVSALHSNDSSFANAPGYVPRYDPRGFFEKNFNSIWPENGSFQLFWVYNIVRTTLIVGDKSLLSYPEKVLTRSGLAEKSNFEYRDVFETEFQSLLEAVSLI